MIAVAAVVAFFVLFIGVRFVLAIRAGFIGGGTRAEYLRREGAALRSGSHGGKERERKDKAGMSRILDAERDRRRIDDARRVADANARRLQEDMAKRSRDRLRAETDRQVRNAMKRGRGW